MEPNFSLRSQQDELQKCISTCQTSRLVLNKDGIKLLQETTEAVRAAISKINFFKHYIKEQIESSTLANSNLETIRFLTQELNEIAASDEIYMNQLNSTPTNLPIQSLTDFNLQVFFTIIDNKITESEVREALEKEGFEDFVITIKNRLNHTFGFIKFSNEDSVTRAVELNLKISLKGQLIKIRPYKSIKNCNKLSKNLNEDVNNVSQEIDEALLINVSSGYQNRRVINSYYELVNCQLEKNEGEFINSEINNTFADSSEAGDFSKMNKFNFIKTVNENMNEQMSLLSEDSYSKKIQERTEIEQKRFETLPEPIKGPINSSKKNSKKRKSSNKKNKDKKLNSNPNFKPDKNFNSKPNFKPDKNFNSKPNFKPDKNLNSKPKFKPEKK